MYGEILKEAPEGFVPYQQWPEYGLVADIPPFLKPRVVGKNPVGLYRRLWPIVIEEYTSDTEPILADSDPEGISANRIITWQRIFRTGAHPGWRNFFTTPGQTEGFAILEGADYQLRWSESARRYARKWNKECLSKEFCIETIPPEEFVAAYRHSDVKTSIRNLYTELIERKIVGGSALECIIARHIPSGDIASGMVLANSATGKASHYIAGFIQKKYEHVPAMVGLMDHWHAHAYARGMRFLHFGRFWQKGDPKDWKGFSQFKAKFGLHYISYPPPLWRFQKGKLF